MATDTGGNQAVDYIWGNMAPQPDDDRDTPLDPSEGFHAMLVANYNGFPDYTPVAPFLDEIANVAVPVVTGVLVPIAEQALQLAGLLLGTDTPTHVGATVSNDFKVKSQAIAAGSLVNFGTSVNVGTYAAPTVPDVLGLDETAAEAALVAAHLAKGAVTTSATSATTVNDGKVKTQTPASGGKANTGSTVALVKYLAPTVPDVLGMTESDANTALVAAGLVKGAVTTADNAAGATAENDGLVKTQTPASGGKADTGSSVALVKYAYTA